MSISLRCRTWKYGHISPRTARGQPTGEPPANQAEEWPHAVLTAIGPIQMDESTFQVYQDFEQFQGRWLSKTDQIYALSVIFQSESLPRKG
jgi:hypothetical protein